LSRENTLVKKKIKDKKYHIGSGSIVDEDGTVYATCEGKFFPVPEETGAYVLDKGSSKNNFTF
jgi:hypothetical protein